MQCFETYFRHIKSAALHCATSRLLHSLSLVAVGLSVGYETWPPIGWNRPFEISWSTCRLELPCVPKHYRLTWSMGIYTVLQRPLTVPLHSPNGKQMPAVRAVKRDCERVYVTGDQCVYMVPFSTNPNGLEAGRIRNFSLKNGPVRIFAMLYKNTETTRCFVIRIFRTIYGQPDPTSEWAYPQYMYLT